MIDQIFINGKASFDDFGASVHHKETNPPKKKSIKEKVPYSNIVYNFSKLNGEQYWEERELKYFCEITAPTAEMLEEVKTYFSNWVMNVFEAEIYDTFTPDFHYYGTFEDISFSDQEDMEKTTATVIFAAYPYKIANRAKKYTFAVGAQAEKAVEIVNASSHRLTPKITTSAAIVLVVDNARYVVGAGTFEDDTFKIAAGLNNITIQNTEDAECTVKIEFHEEVF